MKKKSFKKFWKTKTFQRVVVWIIIFTMLATTGLVSLFGGI